MWMTDKYAEQVTTPCRNALKGGPTFVRGTNSVSVWMPRGYVGIENATTLMPLPESKSICYFYRVS